jgi:hypothetical protein
MIDHTQHDTNRQADVWVPSTRSGYVDFIYRPELWMIYNVQRFGNWICFRLQVRRKHILCWVHWLRLALSKGPTKCLSPRMKMETNPFSETLCFLGTLNSGRRTKHGDSECYKSSSESVAFQHSLNIYILCMRLNLMFVHQPDHCSSGISFYTVGEIYFYIVTRYWVSKALPVRGLNVVNLI